MKASQKDINLSSVLKIIFEEAGHTSLLSIKKETLSLLPGEGLLIESVSSFVDGLGLAHKLLAAKKRVLKNDEKSPVSTIALVPAETAYDEDLNGLLKVAQCDSDLVYVCYNQQATLKGLACGATPRGAKTKSSPVTTFDKGSPFPEKQLNAILIAGGCNYAATASAFFEDDLRAKIKRSLSLKGFRFINVLTPDINFWGYNPESTEEVGKLANNTGFWPLYEFEKGSFRININHDKPQPLVEFFALQKRFTHLILPGNRKLLDNLQEEVEGRWEELIQKSKANK